MDIIHIKDLEIWANHGVFPEENALGQKFVVCADLFTNVRRAGLEDALDFSCVFSNAVFIRRHNSV